VRGAIKSLARSVFIRERFNDRRDDFVGRAFSRTGLNISLGDELLHKRMYTRALSPSPSPSLSFSLWRGKCARRVAREDVTTIHRSATEGRSWVADPCAGPTKKNPINYFYGDKFPPGDARFLSQAVTARVRPRNDASSVWSRAHGSLLDHISCYVNFQVNKVYQEVT